MVLLEPGTIPTKQNLVQIGDFREVKFSECRFSAGLHLLSVNVCRQLPFTDSGVKSVHLLGPLQIGKRLDFFHTPE